jgi:hypothetical protein
MWHALNRPRQRLPSLSHAVHEEAIGRLAALPPIAHDPMLTMALQQIHQTPSDPMPMYQVAYRAHHAGHEPYAQALRDFVIDCYPHVTPMHHLERSRQRIRRGEWAWDEYEWRWKDTEYLSYANRASLASVPWWDGEPLDGALFVLHEGGFGDAIQMYRYLPLCLGRCATVYVLGGLELARLVARAYGRYGNLKLLVPGDTWPVYDRIIPAMSLPALFGPVPGAQSGSPMINLPDVGMVHAAREIVTEERHAGVGPAERRIGVCWQGRAEPDPLRSMPVNALQPLVDDDRLPPLLSLQGGAVDAGPHRIEHRPIRDFADTARLIMHCEAVVTIDTSVAHLAGAIGRPTYLCLSYAACWRWGQQISTATDWYPSMTIVRQETPGDWSGVIDRVRTLLRG